MANEIILENLINEEHRASNALALARMARDRHAINKWKHRKKEINMRIKKMINTSNNKDE